MFRNAPGSCPYCNKFFAKLSYHMEDKHFPNPTPCTICGKVFQSINKMRTHRSSAHRHDKSLNWRYLYLILDLIRNKILDTNNGSFLSLLTLSCFIRPGRFKTLASHHWWWSLSYMFQGNCLKPPTSRWGYSLSRGVSLPSLRQNVLQQEQTVQPCFSNL